MVTYEEFSLVNDITFLVLKILTRVYNFKQKVFKKNKHKRKVISNDLDESIYRFKIKFKLYIPKYLSSIHT